MLNGLLAPAGRGHSGDLVSRVATFAPLQPTDRTSPTGGLSWPESVPGNTIQPAVAVNLRARAARRRAGVRRLEIAARPCPGHITYQ